MTGAVERYNKNYFPNTRSNYFKTYSPFIIRVLKKIQKYKKYEIILKDYPNSPDKQFWKSVIEYYKLTKVKYISNEISMNNLINNNQLIISPWLSTTFFQSLPYKNKILILDKTHFSPLQKKLDKDLNFFKSEKSLLNYLDNFLPLFNNYKFRFHKKSIKYFLNGNNHKIHKFNIHQELKKFLSFDYN